MCWNLWTFLSALVVLIYSICNAWPVITLDLGFAQAVHDDLGQMSCLWLLVVQLIAATTDKSFSYAALNSKQSRVNWNQLKDSVAVCLWSLRHISRVTQTIICPVVGWGIHGIAGGLPGVNHCSWAVDFDVLLLVWIVASSSLLLVCRNWTKY